ncbi:hypothetical protein J2128_001346 [Methanomicrobium sp. W14]|uniref:hypothetical protein n=1 Tax=Methanomicrobium sp. W14 TaxID=2817839 RepID=UPI001AE5817A|nr:hypothetical protein [Methanomicrobium sp. W14]MBP2133392.1 hypothetical protein [Methanomicrobium sp. W14]
MAKPLEKKHYKMVTTRMPPNLVEKLEQISYENRTDRSTEIIRACEEYTERFFSNQATGVAESSAKYTTQDYKKAENDNELRAEILKNTDNPLIKLILIELEQRSKKA